MNDLRFRGLTKSQILNALRPVVENGVPNPDSAHLLDVGTEAYLDLLDKEFLQTGSGLVGSTVRIFEGPSGSGKTHLLHLLSRRASAANYVTVRTNLSDSLHLEDWKLVTRHILERMEARVGGCVTRSFPAILSTVGRHNPEGLCRALEQSKAPHPGFKMACSWALRTLKTQAGAEILFGFLRGERVSAVELAAQGFLHVKDPLSQRNAEWVLRTVAQIITMLGFQGLMLLFDENENSLVVHGDRPSQRVLAAANLLRRLVDACASNEMPNTLIVFTVLPQFLDNAKKALPALGLRTASFRNIWPLTRTTGDHCMEPGWRFPIQEVRRAAYPLTSEQWCNGVVDRYCEILEFFDVPAMRHREQLTQHVSQYARTDASAGVRRKIQKGLSELVFNLASQALLPENDGDEDDF